MNAFNYNSDDSLDAFADLLEPASVIMGDAELKNLLKSDQPRIKAVKYAIKNHKKEILAIFDGESPETYKVNILTLPFKFMELLNTPEIIQLFTAQSRRNSVSTSGSATENTEGGGE